MTVAVAGGSGASQGPTPVGTKTQPRQLRPSGPSASSDPSGGPGPSSPSIIAIPSPGSTGPSSPSPSPAPSTSSGAKRHPATSSTANNLTSSLLHVVGAAAPGLEVGRQDRDGRRG